MARLALLFGSFRGGGVSTSFLALAREFLDRGHAVDLLVGKPQGDLAHLVPAAARVVPLSDGDLQLTFANVPFAGWAIWLASVERELGGRAMSVTANANGTPGNVDVELALRLARK